MFWDKSFTDEKRLKITTFCYQNGVSEVLHSVLSFTQKWPSQKNADGIYLPVTFILMIRERDLSVDTERTLWI